MKELVAARQAKAGAVVTAEQATTLKTLLGEPFTGSTQPDPRRGARGPRPSSPNPLRAALFGKYSAEFTQLAGNKSIQDELKMTAEQVKQAVETRNELQSKYLLRGVDSDTIAKVYADRSKAIEDALGKVLTAAQAKRFREIMLQSREQVVNVPAGGFGVQSTVIASAAAYPGVADTIKLTDEQKKQLLDNTAPAAVLTADQKTAITKMLGEPFKGEFTIVRSGPTRPTRPTLSPTLQLFTAFNRTPSVEQVLKLSPEQAKKIAAAREEYQTANQATGFGGFGGGFGGGPTGGAGGFPGGADSEATKALTAAIEKFEKVVAETLSADQKVRVAQLLVQSNAAGSLVATLTVPEMVKTLDLTADQTAKLTALGEDAVKLQDLRSQEGVSDPEGKLAYHLRDAADERMLAVLTADQKAKWKELTGAPWPGLTKTIPFGRGGRGGFPGGGFNSNLQVAHEAAFGRFVNEFYQLAYNPDVQAELKLTPEQVQKVQTALTETTPGGSLGGAPTTVEAAAKYFEELAAKHEKALAAIVTVDQRKRLRQVQIQILASSRATNGFEWAGAAAYPGVAEAIKLTPEQKTKLLSGMRPADVLSDEQQTAIKAMFGEPYKGRTTTSPTRGGRGGALPGGGGALPGGGLSP